MRLPGQRSQRLRALGQIPGLMEDRAFERKRLIGADAVSVRTHRADRERLGFGQLDRQIFKRPIACEIPIFKAAFVDLRRDGLRFQSRRRK